MHTKVPFLKFLDIGEEGEGGEGRGERGEGRSDVEKYDEKHTVVVCKLY